MATPGIEAIIDKLSTVVEALTPTLEATGPGGKFRRSTERVTIERMPLLTSKRLFNIDFVGMRDLSAEGRGVQTPSIADKQSTLRLRIYYPRGKDERSLEKVIASDTEILQRSLSDATKWTGTNYRRAVGIASVTREVAEGKALYVETNIEIQYRDDAT